MTNNPMLSVERELLERAASAIEKHHGSLQWVIATELRALLDKSAAWERDMDYRPEELVSPETEPACWTCNDTKVVDDGELTHSSGGIPFEMGPIKCVKDCPDCSTPTPEHQGEPVAWSYKVRVYAHGIGMVWRDKIEREAPDTDAEDVMDLTPLYAERPAPVAVVMPERKKDGKWVDDGSGNGSSEWHEDPDANGYNEALDEVARLNGVKP